MRLHNKYKIYNQAGIIPVIYHKRLLNFKRPKWQKLQKALRPKTYSSLSFINNLLIKNSFKSWDKISTYYKDGLKAKNNIYCLFDSAISYKQLDSTLKEYTKNYSTINIVLKNLIKSEFKLDTLLWRLFLANSSYKARHFINSGQVLVNEKLVCGNFLLKKGDVITFSNGFAYKNASLSACYSNFASIHPTLQTFLEVDYYTNSIVIVKDLNDLGSEDLFLMVSNFYNLKKVKDFLQH